MLILIKSCPSLITNSETKQPYYVYNRNLVKPKINPHRFSNIWTVIDVNCR